MCLVKHRTIICSPVEAGIARIAAGLRIKNAFRFAISACATWFLRFGVAINCDRKNREKERGKKKKRKKEKKRKRKRKEGKKRRKNKKQKTRTNKKQKINTKKRNNIFFTPQILTYIHALLGELGYCYIGWNYLISFRKPFISWK